MAEITRIVEYLQSRQKDMVCFLEELVKIESPSMDPFSQEPAFVVLATALRALDFRTRRIPGQFSGGHLYARPRNRTRGRAVQLLLGHIDTAWPQGTLHTMPFQNSEGRLSGPGVYDMKGGLTQLVFALEALCRLELKPQVTPLVFISSDGKIGSGESTAYIRRLARTANRTFVLEPSLGLEGRLKTARKGVGCFTMTVRHNSLPAALNKRTEIAGAMVELSEQIQHLLALNDPAEGVTVNIRMIDSGLRPNVVKPVSRAVIDVRVRTGAAAERLETAMRALSPLHPGVQLDVTGAITRPPMERNPQNEALWNLAYNIGLELGLELRETRADGSSDGNTASQYTATLDGLGAVGESVQGHTEFVFLPKLIERAALLARLMLTPPLDK